jgi:hypothetical protein
MARLRWPNQGVSFINGRSRIAHADRAASLDRRIAPDPPSEGDYRAFCALLSQSERGRALLAEHPAQSPYRQRGAARGHRAHRSATTADAFAAQRLRDDLRMPLIAIRLTRPEAFAPPVATPAPALQIATPAPLRLAPQVATPAAQPADMAAAASAAPSPAAAPAAEIAGTGSRRDSGGRVAAAWRSARRHHGAERRRAPGAVYVVVSVNIRESG